MSDSYSDRNLNRRSAKADPPAPGSQPVSGTDPAAAHAGEEMAASSLPIASALGMISPDDQQTVISKRPPVQDSALIVASNPLEIGKLLAGQRLGHFLLNQFVGGGGMGAVFRGYDEKLGRTVAVKVLSRVQGAEEDTLRRFQNEAQSAARLDHENIARVHYVGEYEGWNYIVFEFIDGVNIRDHVLDKGPLPLEEAVSYTLQVAEALSHASQRDVVHRDIKPSNVLIMPSGHAKLVDMGLARLHHVESRNSDLTASGVTLGTFDYISPEQARDPRSADVRSDIYSLGCTFYFMLTGRPPFPEGTVLQKLLSHTTDDPPPLEQFRPDLPEEVSRVLSKMLAKHPDRRHQQPSELIGDLLVLVDQLGLSTGGRVGTVWATASQRKLSRVEQHLPWLVPLVALFAVIVVLDRFWMNGETIDAAPRPPLFQSLNVPNENVPAGSLPSQNGQSRNGPAADVPSAAVSPGTVSSETAAELVSADAAGATRLAQSGPAPSSATQPSAAPSSANQPSATQPASLSSAAAAESTGLVASRSGSSDQEAGDATGPQSGGPSSVSSNRSGDDPSFSPHDVSPHDGDHPLGSDQGAAPRPTEIAAADVRLPAPADPNADPRPNGSRSPSGADAASVPVELIVGDRNIESELPMYATIADAVAAISDSPSARMGHYIELQYNGRRQRDELPFELMDKDITIRAGEGYAPIVRFCPQVGDPARFPRRMITVTRGSLVLDRLHLEMDLPAEQDRYWSLIALDQARYLQMSRCTMTIRNGAGGRRAFHADVAFFEIMPPVQTDASGISSTPAGREMPVVVDLTDCVVRGEANLVRSDVAQPLRLAWRNGLLVTTERLIVTGGAVQPALHGEHMEIDLNHLTAVADQGLCLISSSDDNAPHQLTVEIRCENSILASLPTMPLIHQLGRTSTERLRGHFIFTGMHNFFEGLPAQRGGKLCWRIESLPAESNGTASSEDKMHFSEWREYWAGTNDNIWKEGQVLWRGLPSERRAVHTLRREDYGLSADPSNPARAFGASDERGDAGFLFKQLPELPGDAVAPPAPVSSGVAFDVP